MLPVPIVKLEPHMIEKEPLYPSYVPLPPVEEESVVRTLVETFEPGNITRATKAPP